MVTRSDVDKLKSDWVQDPVWDIYDTEGFEKYSDELKKFQQEKEKEWEQQRLEREKKIDEKARELGVEGLYREILMLKNKIEELK